MNNNVLESDNNNVDKPLIKHGFQPGNKLGQGRPKKISTQIKDFQKEHPHAYDQLMCKLYAMGLSGDREAAQYVCDRLKGRPRAEIDTRYSGEIKLDYTVLMAKITEFESNYLIGEGTIVQEQRGPEASEQGSDQALSS